jgi:integrase
MADFQMPTSTFRSHERTPPEVQELSLLLSTAVEKTPDIAPLLVLAAVTGIRRGELVGIPLSAVAWKRNQITVASAISSTGKVKATKTRQSRTFHTSTGRWRGLTGSTLNSSITLGQSGHRRSQVFNHKLQEREDY